MNYDHLINFSTQVFGQGYSRSFTRPIQLVMGKSADGALFMSQLVYWSDRSTKSDDGWFYKTYEEWEEELFLTPYKVRKWSEFLEEKGVLERKVEQVNGNKPTLHYKLDMGKLLEWMVEEHARLTAEEETEGEEFDEEGEKIDQESPFKEFCSYYKAVRNADELTKMLSFEFFRHTGFEPTTGVRAWKNSIMELWEASGKKMPLFIEGLKRAEESRKKEGFVYSGPKSYLKFMKNSVALDNKGEPQGGKKEQEYEIINGMKVYTAK